MNQAIQKGHNKYVYETVGDAVRMTRWSVFSWTEMLFLEVPMTEAEALQDIEAKLAQGFERID